MSLIIGMIEESQLLKLREKYAHILTIEELDVEMHGLGQNFVTPQGMVIIRIGIPEKLLDTLAQLGIIIDDQTEPPRLKLT